MDSKDIEQIRAMISERYPSVTHWQLQVVHESDDDGLWFFKLGELIVQVESSTGNCPFLVEFDHPPFSAYCPDSHAVVKILQEKLGLQAGMC